MARWKKALRIIAVAIAVIVLLPAAALTAFEMIRDHRRVDAKVLEQDLRSALPLGSSRSEVEKALTNRHIEHGYSPTCETETRRSQETTRCRYEYAGVRNVKGSTIIIDESVEFYFLFNEEGKLTTITSSTRLTGP